MKKRVIIGAVFIAGVMGAYGLAARRTWGPDLLGDPTYRSGRASLCKPPAISGDSIPTQLQDVGETPRLEGYEHTWEYTFDVGDDGRGAVDLCSEYGSIRVKGVDGTRARLVITMSDPFPGGSAAIGDTRIQTSIREDSGGLRLAMWQLTQGMTTFRSVLQKGARPVAVNVTLELPRAGLYRLAVIANHQRIQVRDLNIHGVVEGYLSPGADLDVGLAGPLTLRLNNAHLKPDDRREAGIDFEGGTTATFRPLVSANVEVSLTKGDATLNFAGDAVGLELNVTATPGPVALDVGPVEPAGADSAGSGSRTAGYAAAARTVSLRATTGQGAITVRRLPSPDAGARPRR